MFSVLIRWQKNTWCPSSQKQILKSEEKIVLILFQIQIWNSHWLTTTSQLVMAQKILIKICTSKYSDENNKAECRIFSCTEEGSFPSTKKEAETHQFQAKWTMVSNNLCNLNIRVKSGCSWQHCAIDFSSGIQEGTVADKVLRPYWLLESFYGIFSSQKNQKYLHWMKASVVESSTSWSCLVKNPPPRKPFLTRIIWLSHITSAHLSISFPCSNISLRLLCLLNKDQTFSDWP